MKLALVTETYPPDINGVAMTLSTLTRHLRGRGHGVMLVHPRSRGARNGKAAGGDGDGPRMEVWGVPIPRYPEAQMGICAPVRLRRMLERERPDLVHVATEGPLGRAALGAAAAAGIPGVATFHTNFHHYTQHYGVSWLRRSVERYLRDFHNRARLTLVPDEALMGELARWGIRRVRYLGRGVDTALFDPRRRDDELRREWGCGPGDPVVLYVGRVAAEKNIPLAIEAYREIRREAPGARMVVVGDGPARRALQRRHPGVRFTGMRVGEELARHYASGDLFVFASETETFGNVIPEAMASGLVCVGYDYAAARQRLRDGENGFVAPPGDRAAFLEAARRAARECRGGREQELRRRARETALQHPWTRVADAYESLALEAMEPVA